MTQPFEAHLQTCLQNASSGDKATRDQAEAGIQQLQEADWGSFIGGLANELANESAAEVGRQMAGLLLKNALDAKDARVQAARSAKWKSLDDKRKQQIRTALLQTLASSAHSAAHSAAMAIAKVARIELTEGAWPDLLTYLNNCVAPESPGTTRVFALECLGFICEEHVDVADRFPQQETNRMLTSIVQGMAGNQPTEVRHAATRALCDAIEFASMNFERQEERDYLMQMICEATICPDARVRLAAYQNLNKVADLHYKFLEPYIQTIYQLTTQSFVDTDDEVAMQAIEFWSALAEIEALLKDEEDEVSSDADLACKNFLDRCAKELVPLLLQLLTTQEENQDDDDTLWNKCMSATVCLINVFKATGGLTLPLVQTFIQAGVQRRSAPEDWRSRDAAITAFGCAVDGPSRQELLPFVQEGFVFLLMQGLRDEAPMVQRTTLWTLGRIFESLHAPNAAPPLVTAANAGSIVDALLGAMKMSPGAARKACYAVQALAEGFAPSAESHALTPFFSPIVEALLSVAYAQVPADAAAALHVMAFEAMHTVIAHAAQASVELVVQMIPHLLSRLEATLGGGDASDAAAAAAGGDAAVKATVQRRGELQGQLCAALQVTIKRACQHEAAKAKVLELHADSVMQGLLRVQAARTAVHDEVVMAVSALCQEQGVAFHRYLPSVMPIILAGLQHHEDVQVCRICVNAMGDIAREVGGHVAPYADEVMRHLLADLSSESLHRDVKPDILHVFGDLAQGLGAGFDRYAAQAVETLQAAMNVAYTNQVAYRDDAVPDEALVLYNNDLRIAIVQAAAGILSSVPEDPAAVPALTSQLLTPFARNLLRFVSLIHEDECADDGLTKETVGLLGDLAGLPSLAADVANPTNKAWIVSFMKASQAATSAPTWQYAQQRLMPLGIVI